MSPSNDTPAVCKRKRETSALKQTVSSFTQILLNIVNVKDISTTLAAAVKQQDVFTRLATKLLKDVQGW